MLDTHIFAALLSLSNTSCWFYTVAPKTAHFHYNCPLSSLECELKPCWYSSRVGSLLRSHSQNTRGHFSRPLSEFLTSAALCIFMTFTDLELSHWCEIFSQFALWPSRCIQCNLQPTLTPEFVPVKLRLFCSLLAMMEFLSEPASFFFFFVALIILPEVLMSNVLIETSTSSILS